MPASIELYVDILSPFGYIAYYILRHSPSFQALSITYTPILLGGLLKKTNGVGPLAIINKATWIEDERLRLASALHVPIIPTRPNNFPFPTVKCQRVLTCLALRSQDVLVKALDALSAALWVEGRNVGDLNVVKDVLYEVFEGDFVEEVVRESDGESVKEALKGNTETAFERGAFGLPWFVVEVDGRRKGFWGVDRLGSVLKFAGRVDDGVGMARAML